MLNHTVAGLHRRQWVSDGYWTVQHQPAHNYTKHQRVQVVHLENVLLSANICNLILKK